MEFIEQGIYLDLKKRWKKNGVKFQKILKENILDGEEKLDLVEIHPSIENKQNMAATVEGLR